MQPAIEITTDTPTEMQPEIETEMQPAIETEMQPAIETEMQPAIGTEMQPAIEKTTDTPPQPPPQKVDVVQGTCGWLDQQYPSTVKKDAASRLEYYSKHWPSVEVNSSCYTILSPATTSKWCAMTPKNSFLFHFKAFGLFCSKGCPFGQLPAGVRGEVVRHQGGDVATTDFNTGTFVAMENMPGHAIQQCWDLFNASMEPMYRDQKLGVVMFQFHLSFRPSQENLEYVLDCRQRLDSRYNMAVEFRCRSWFTNSFWLQQIRIKLRDVGVGLVAADELEHETFQKDKHQTGLPPGGIRRVLPIALEVTNPDFFYVRVHRRHGMEDRRLDEKEIEDWCKRLERICVRQGFQGTVYFLWGTDHKNVPQTNRAALRRALPEGIMRNRDAGSGSSVLQLLMLQNEKKKKQTPVTPVPAGTCASRVKGHQPVWPHGHDDPVGSVATALTEHQQEALCHVPPTPAEDQKKQQQTIQHRKTKGIKRYFNQRE